MTYYTDSAYTAKQDVSAGHCREVFTENSVDVREFPEHEEYLLLDNCRVLWHGKDEFEPSLKTTKGEAKKNIERILNLHRTMYFPAMDNSTMTAFMVHSVKSIGYCCLFIFLLAMFNASENESKAIYICFFFLVSS